MAFHQYIELKKNCTLIPELFIKYITEFFWQLLVYTKVIVKKCTIWNYNLIFGDLYGDHFIQEKKFPDFSLTN